MNWYWLALIGYGVVALLYALAFARKWFEILEGESRNGFIITMALTQGLLWPWNVFWHGLKSTVQEILPEHAAPAPAVVVAPPPPGQVANPNATYDTRAPADLEEGAI